MLLQQKAGSSQKKSETKITSTIRGANDSNEVKYDSVKSTQTTCLLKSYSSKCLLSK